MGLLSGIRGFLGHGASKGHGDVVARINDHLARQWDAYVTSSLLARTDVSLFPTAVRHTGGSIERRQLLAYDTRAVSQGGGKPVTFREFFRKSWAEGRQTHLFVTGEGGIGKTVSLLCFATDPEFLPAGTPAVYVPMHQLGKFAGSSGGCIDAFLRKAFSDREHEELVRRAHEPWSGGPSLILLLDGYNEIRPDLRHDIEEDIADWAVMPGTQVVVTSRVGSLHRVRTTSIELLPLGRDVVERYLHGYGVDGPAADSRLWEVISTPLMLQLYADVELFRERYGEARWLRLEPSDSAGVLIWNYLMRELYRNIEDRSPTRRNDAAAYVDAVLLVLPYVCWRMEVRQRFELGDDELVGLVRDACAYWREAGTEPKRVAAIKDHISEPTHVHFDDERFKVLVSILSDETGLLHWHAGDRTYTLMHQNFRDGLAALHIRNAAEVTGSVPAELDEPLSEYVKGFLADVISDKLLDNLWERNRVRKPTIATSTHNLLRVVQARHDGDLSLLSFAGMDLRGISLYGYRRNKGGDALFKGGRDGARRFDGTLLDAGCMSTQGHLGWVLSASFSPDGRLLASGSVDGSVCLWDTGTRECVAVMASNGGWVESLCFSPDGHLLASGYRDSVRLWDVKARKCLAELEDVGRVRFVSFSPDGRLLALGIGDCSVRLWDAGSRKCLVEIEVESGDRVSSACLSPDGCLLASGSGGGTVCLWDTATRECLAEMRGDGGKIRSVSFSPDGHLLASGSGDGAVRLWDIGTHECLAVMEGRLAVESVCFSPNGGFLASGSWDGLVRLWDVKTYERIVEMGGQEDEVWSVCFSRDGRLVAAGLGDGAVRLWDASTHARLAEMAVGRGWVESVSFSPDGRILASGSWDGIRLWDASTRECLAEMANEGGVVWSVGFSPDGRFIASGSDDGLVHLWDTKTHDCLAEMAVGGCTVHAVCFSPDGLLMAAGSEDGFVRLWNVNTREFLPEMRSGSAIESVSFSPDGHFLASGSHDGTVRLWDVNTRECLLEMRGGSAVESVSFSPDGRLLASGTLDGAIRLWDVGTGKYLLDLVGGGGRVNSVSFSPDGRLLASGTLDGAIRLWDVSTGEYKHDLRGGIGWVSSVRFSPDSHFVAAGFSDGCVRLWDTETLEELDTIRTIYGIRLFGLDLSLAVMDDEDRKILLQNGVKVPPPGSMERYLAARAESGRGNKGEGNETMPNIPHFKIGFTFTGKNYRDSVVRPACEALLTMGYTEDEIFLDEWHEPLVAQVGADVLLQKIYHDHCDVVVVLLSPDYAGNNWTGHVEWRAVRNLINTGASGKICLLRVDDTDMDSIDGLYAKSDIAMNVDGKSPERVARDIVKWIEYRRKANGGANAARHSTTR